DGTPETIYREPASAFVADFVGRCNQLPGRVAGVDATTGYVTLELEGGDRLQVPWRGRDPLPGRVMAFTRPEHVRVSPSGALSGILRSRPRRGRGHQRRD